MSTTNSPYPMANFRADPREKSLFTLHGQDSMIQPPLPDMSTISDFGRYDQDSRQPNGTQAQAQAQTTQHYGGWQQFSQEPHTNSYQQSYNQYPSQCQYQYPVSQRPLHAYPMYQTPNSFQLPDLQATSANQNSHGFSLNDYARDNFFNMKTNEEKPSQPSPQTCAESLISPVDKPSCDAGNQSSSTGGSPYQTGLEPYSVSHSSSGYGSSTGSTSTSPFPSPDSVQPTLLQEPTNPIIPTPAPSSDTQTVKPKKARTSYTADQIRTLETAFQENAYPDYDKLEELSKALGVPERKVKVWFQNKRARWRKKNAASPVYNPAMYSAPAAVPAPVKMAAPVSVPAKFPATAPNGYSAPYPARGFQTPTSSLYPSHAHVTPFPLPSIVSDQAPAPRGFSRSNMGGSSTISYLPPSMQDCSNQKSFYPVPLYQPQYPARSRLTLS